MRGIHCSDLLTYSHRASGTVAENIWKYKLHTGDVFLAQDDLLCSASSHLYIHLRYEFRLRDVRLVLFGNKGGVSTRHSLGHDCHLNDSTVSTNSRCQKKPEMHLMNRGCIRCEVGDEGVASLVVCGNAEVLLVSNSTLPVLAEDVLVVRILKVCNEERMLLQFPEIICI